MRELSLCRNNKDSLAQPQVILVVPGGALGTLARRSAEKDTRRRVTGGLPAVVIYSNSVASSKRCCGRCRNTSFKTDKWCIMWLAFARLLYCPLQRTGRCQITHQSGKPLLQHGQQFTGPPRHGTHGAYNIKSIWPQVEKNNVTDDK